jgi:S-adenosyl-L-methionine hydrolase (adenosine-forming)
VRLINLQPVSTKELEFSQIHGCEWPDEISRIIYIDHYGNLLTGIRNLSQQQQLSLSGLKPIAYADTFSSVPAGELFWYYNSMGLVEIAANGGSAAVGLSANLGDTVQVL